MRVPVAATGPRLASAGTADSVPSVVATQLSIVWLPPQITFGSARKPAMPKLQPATATAVSAQASVRLRPTPDVGRIRARVTG